MRHIDEKRLFELDSEDCEEIAAAIAFQLQHDESMKVMKGVAARQRDRLRTFEQES